MKTVGPFRLGITGGIGCGKSTVGKILAERGWHVIDTDDIARHLLTSDSQTICEILSVWPEARDPKAGIDRKALAHIVFSDTHALNTLNTITHPKIRQIWITQRQAAFNAGRPTAVIIPLLHEVGAAKEFDAVVCVGCTLKTQLQRLEQRGWSKEQIRARIRAQFPLERKAELSDGFLWNESKFEAIGLQLSNLNYTLEHKN